MVTDDVIRGKMVCLRPVEESDAEFILSVRNDPKISKYLPKLNVTVEEQKVWIKHQREDDSSYYFIIESVENQRLGTISVYDIENRHGESGRFCSIGNPLQNVEAMFLLYDFCFCQLQLELLKIWVFTENKKVISLDSKLGYEWEEPLVNQEGREYRVGYLYPEEYKVKTDLFKSILSL